ncbi:phospholipase B [Mycena floridula]|nr:phospholipase B [Mycena floridula]
MISSLVGFALSFAALLPLASGQGSVTDYAPDIHVQCPDTPLLRLFSAQNQSLHPDEVAYVNSRQLRDEWKGFLGDIGYNISAFSSFPKVGMAISGGGYRAAQYGAGVISALDGRNASAKAAGTGGLLQVTSYMSALSGSSFLLSSLYMNDFPTIQDLVFGDGQQLSGWLLDLNLLTPDGLDVTSARNQEYFGSLMWSVGAKANQGFDPSLTDPWARALSYHFLNQTSRANFFTNDSAHGAGQLWSQIPALSSFQQHSVPFPLMIADARPNGFNASGLLSLDTTVYEMSPFEIASFDPSLSTAANMKFVGTQLSNGLPANSTACVTGFDDAGFLMGSSSSLFNQIFAQPNFLSQDIQALDFLSQLLQEIRETEIDAAIWPNPFKGIASSDFQDSSSDFLQLIDGGSNGEVLPLGSLLVKARDMDVIIAVDSSSDDDNHWPTGVSLFFSVNRTLNILQSTHQQMPPLPASTDDFVSQGLNQRPVFFGCQPVNIPAEYPLVIYLPNSPPLNGDKPVTNTDTFKLDYTVELSQLFIDQVYVNTIGGFQPNTNLPDPNWGKCLQCASIDRARLGTSINRSDICSECFKQYCFDPKNLTSKSALPNRNLVSVDTANLQNQAKDLVTKHKTLVIGISIAAALIAMGLLATCTVWCIKRNRVVYHPIEPLNIHHY